jgi:hypothetical protein
MPGSALKMTALMLLAGAVVGESCFAQSTHWCGEMLVRFPESLLLEPAYTAPAASVSSRKPDPGEAGHARVTSADEPVSQGSGGSADAAGSTVAPPETATQPVPATVVLPGEDSRAVTAVSIGPAVACPSPVCRAAVDELHILPDGLLYHSYLAGEKEPRMAARLLGEKDRGTVFEGTIGGRIGMLRFGTSDPIHPEGWQWDLESAAMLRQDPEQEWDVEATDFRIGSVLTWRRGPLGIKAGYYHLSSHVGDEFLVRNPGFVRANYLRDALLLGLHRYLTDDLAIYGELAYAFKTDGGADPWELQFGAEYCPLEATGVHGAPCMAVNAHLREEYDFGGGVNIIAGWQWRGSQNNRRFRIGAQYYNGKELQWSFVEEDVVLIGGGVWYDF